MYVPVDAIRAVLELRDDPAIQRSFADLQDSVRTLHASIDFEALDAYFAELNEAVNTQLSDPAFRDLLANPDGPPGESPRWATTYIGPYYGPPPSTPPADQRKKDSRIPGFLGDSLDER